MTSGSEQPSLHASASQTGNQDCPARESAGQIQSTPSCAHYINWLRICTMVWVSFCHTLWLGTMNTSNSPAYGGVQTPQIGPVSYIIGRFLLGSTSAYGLGLFYFRIGFADTALLRRIGVWKFLVGKTRMFLVPIVIWDVLLYPMLLYIGSGSMSVEKYRRYFENYTGAGQLQMWHIVVSLVLAWLLALIACCCKAANSLYRRGTHEEQLLPTTASTPPASILNGIDPNDRSVSSRRQLLQSESGSSGGSSLNATDTEYKTVTVASASTPHEEQQNPEQSLTAKRTKPPGCSCICMCDFGHLELHIAGAQHDAEVTRQSSAEVHSNPVPFTNKFMCLLAVMLFLVQGFVMWGVTLHKGLTWNLQYIIFQYCVLGQYTVSYFIGAFVERDQLTDRLPLMFGWWSMGLSVVLYTGAYCGDLLRPEQAYPRGYLYHALANPAELHPVERSSWADRIPTAGVQISASAGPTGQLLSTSSSVWLMIDCLVTQAFVVLFSIGFLAISKAYWNRKPGRIGRWHLDASYTFYIVFPLVLVGLERAFAHLQWPQQPLLYVVVVWPLCVAGGYALAIAIRFLPGAHLFL